MDTQLLKSVFRRKINSQPLKCFFRRKYFEFSASVCFVLLVVAFILYDQLWPHEKAAFSIIAAGLLATIGWMFQSTITILNHRGQHTLNMLLEMRQNPQLQRSRDLIFDRYPPRVNIDKKSAEDIYSAWRSRHDKTADANTRELVELARAIIYVANFYEFVSAAIRNGDLDENLLKDSQRLILKSFHDKSHTFLDEIRKTPDPADSQSKLHGQTGQALAQTSFRHFYWLIKETNFTQPNYI